MGLNVVLKKIIDDRFEYNSFAKALQCINGMSLLLYPIQYLYGDYTLKLK